MDLYSFIKTHIQKGDINTIKRGFKDTPFTKDSCDIPAFVKEILKSLLEQSSKNISYTQSSNGGLQSMNKILKTEINHKQSFCVEFPEMLTNVLALMGFEFSYCLINYIGIDITILKYIEKLYATNSYKDIQNIINVIKNMYNLGEGNSILINKEFTSQYIDDVDTSFSFNNITTSSKKEEFFNNLLNEIDDKVKNTKNVAYLLVDKDNYINELINLYNHTEFTEYTINNVDQLCLNLGKDKICYEGYFIKLWELLYLESLVDLSNGDIRNLREITKNPAFQYITDILELELKPHKILMNFNSYFLKIYNEVVNTMFIDNNDIKNIKFSIQNIKPGKHLNVNVSENMYKYLSNIALNLFVNIAKKIVANQKISQLSGKSTRIQFIQIFQALEDSTPRLQPYNDSQLAMIHYILLSQNTLENSYNIIMGETDKKKKVRKPRNE